MSLWHLEHGDCRTVMAQTMNADTIDAIVCDPPYLLDFMGKEWDASGPQLPPSEIAFRAWFAGLCAGEAYFRIHKEKGGTYYACHFGIHMRADDGPLLRALAKKTGAGTIREEGAVTSDRGVNSSPSVRWEAQSRADCQKIAKLLDGAPLYGKKQREYDLWRRALTAWEQRPRGNRWHGAGDNSVMASFYEAMKELRPFDEDLAASQFDPFMPRDQLFHYQWAVEALRVAKPGAHLLAFGGTRTHHRLMVAIEDAGWEIRDCLMWLYGSGFPKSLDVSKAIDARERGAMVRAKLLHFAAARGVDGRWLESHGVASASSFNDWTVGGHVPSERNWQIIKEAIEVSAEEEAAFEREVVGSQTKARSTSGASALPTIGGDTVYRTWDVTATATEAARQWDGWGTALKPAWEPVIVARKPLVGTVADNVIRYGTGALNIDGGRIDGVKGKPASPSSAGSLGWSTGDWERKQDTTLGRWPANVLLDEEAARLLDAQSGENPSRWGKAPQDDSPRYDNRSAYGDGLRAGTPRYDAGGASRFFYTAKASRSERTHYGFVECKHPTVKPLDLMRYLVRLVTPPDGLVLDPFMGSGSTGVAAVECGFRFVGIEQDADSVETARERLRRLSPEPLPLFGRAG